MQDDVGGLEVEYNGKWYPITPIPGTLIINLGRMLEYFTYGVAKGKSKENMVHYDKILGAWHRVKAHKTERFSWPFFMNPSMDAHFARLEEFQYNEKKFAKLEQERRVNVSGTYEPGTQFGSGTYRDWHNEYVVNSDAHRRNKGHLFIWELEDRKAIARNEEE